MIYRHGDVILRQIPVLPLNFDLISDEPSCVLAEGEITGHQHVLTASEGMILFAKAQSGSSLAIHHGLERYVKLDAPATLTHQEHKAITVQPGIYEILQEREYDFLRHRPVSVLD